MNCYYLKSCTFAPQIKRTMEQKFKKSDGGIDLRTLREFCRKEGKMVEYRKGEQLEREGDPARWFGFVTEGCFKYVTYGISNDKACPCIADVAREYADLNEVRACSRSTK